MISRIQQMYKNLEQCTLSLEEDVESSLQQLKYANKDILELETSKDYHYREILNQLKEIKQHIKIIADHDQRLQSIIGAPNHSKIDKNYIKRQVDNFQKIETVPRRVNKPVRPPETSFSMKILECWEKILEDEEVKKYPSQALPFVIKREESLRKKKKIVSSTIETFLDPNNNLNIGRSKSVDALNTVLLDEYVDSKPRIVDVIYKKDVKYASSNLLENA